MSDSPDTAHSQHITDHHFVPKEGEDWGRCQYPLTEDDNGPICGMSEAAHQKGAIEDTDPGRPATMRGEEPVGARTGRISSRLPNLSTPPITDAQISSATDGSRGMIAPADGQSERADATAETAPIAREAIMQREGHKDDAGKAPYFYLPWVALEEVAYVMEFGAKKYDAGNYQKGMDAGRLMSAGIRHWVAWWKGEDLDPESGRHHLAHSACCVLMCLETVAFKTIRDNRYVYMDTLA